MNTEKGSNTSATHYEVGNSTFTDQFRKTQEVITNLTRETQNAVTSTLRNPSLIMQLEAIQLRTLSKLEQSDRAEHDIASILTENIACYYLQTQLPPNQTALPPERTRGFLSSIASRKGHALHTTPDILILEQNKDHTVLKGIGEVTMSEKPFNDKGKLAQLKRYRDRQLIERSIATIKAKSATQTNTDSIQSFPLPIVLPSEDYQCYYLIPKPETKEDRDYLSGYIKKQTDVTVKPIPLTTTQLTQLTTAIFQDSMQRSIKSMNQVIEIEEATQAPFADTLTLLLIDDGLSPKEAANHLGIHKGTIILWAQMLGISHPEDNEVSIDLVEEPTVTDYNLEHADYSKLPGQMDRKVFKKLVLDHIAAEIGSTKSRT